MKDRKEIKPNRLDNLERFAGVRMNTDLLGKLLLAKYNGEHKPRRNWVLSVVTIPFKGEVLSYDKWREYIHIQSNLVFEKLQ